MSAGHRVTAGFLPLLDSALLIAAREKSFAEAEGIDLVLVRVLESALDRVPVRGPADCRPIGICKTSLTCPVVVMPA